ncbi:ankyrin repeat-containing domain protein [Biscogniauxia marginata]|nr:ankyrin repeat-containing domain protein [Biscogniauxia marginata]
MYLTQALQYHLSKCSVHFCREALRPFLEKPEGGGLTLWAKAYWAVSNSVSQTSIPPKLALPVLATLGIIFQEDVQNNNEKMIPVHYIKDAGGQDSVLEEMFLEVIKVNNERMALEILSILLSERKAASHSIIRLLSGLSSYGNAPNQSPWLGSAIWAATWLNMDRLVDMMLRNGARPEPEDMKDPLLTRYFASPLSMATYLGHTATVRVLLHHKAKTDVLMLEKFDCVSVTALQGHVEVMQEYSRELKYPEHLLRISSSLGNWKFVTALLDLGYVPKELEGSIDKQTLLAEACAKGYPKITEALLRYGASPNITSPSHEDTPLSIAAISLPSVQCVRHLLRYGGNPNHQDLRPPLIHKLAGSSNNTVSTLRICDLLVNNDPPLSLTIKAADDATALMKACKAGQPAMVEWLLLRGANINAQDKNNFTALHFAVQVKNTAVVQELLKRKPTVDITAGKAEQTPLHMALYDKTTRNPPPDPRTQGTLDGSVLIVKMLLDAGADPHKFDFEQRKVFDLAAAQQKLDILKILIEYKVNKDGDGAKGWAPIYQAVDKSFLRAWFWLQGHWRKRYILDELPRDEADFLKSLLKHLKPADLEVRNSENETALLAASNSFSLEWLQFLIKTGANVNAQDSRGCTPLINVVDKNSGKEWISALTSRPETQINLASRFLGGPIHILCRSTDAHQINYLLDCGADVNLNVPTIRDGTPLIALLLALECWGLYKIDKIVKTFVEHGADVQMTVKSTFYNAISTACFVAEASMIRFLLEKGASADDADPVSGRLPIHFAAMNGVGNLEAFLEHYTGDLMAADVEGKNCLHWAAQFGNAKAMELILSRLSDDRKSRSDCLAVTDSDGWTPLCWAARPARKPFCWKKKSEKGDYMATVQLLLENGADKSVECRIGKGEGAEILTPLDLARRCKADEDVVNMLKQGIESGISSVGHGIYHEPRLDCCICITPIYGLVYKCAGCPNYIVCKKCHTSVNSFHSTEIMDDGFLHTFDVVQDKDEYIEDTHNRD